jgi:hypothetical protein
MVFVGRCNMETNEFASNHLFSLTEREKSDCLKLAEGMLPSTLGRDFTNAAVLMLCFERMVKATLKRLEDMRPENIEKLAVLRKLLDKTSELKAMFKEAARLTGGK